MTAVDYAVYGVIPGDTWNPLTNPQPLLPERRTVSRGCASCGGDHK